MKIIIVSILLIFGISAFFWANAFGDQEIYILPNEYNGTVYIFYDSHNGLPVKYENGERIYEIPRNGILKTQGLIDTRWKPLPKFFYRKGKEKVEIPYRLSNENIIENAQTEAVKYVCCFSTGSAKADGNSDSVLFGVFYVGTDAEIEKAIKSNEKINIYNLSKLEN